MIVTLFFPRASVSHFCVLASDGTGGYIGECASKGNVTENGVYEGLLGLGAGAIGMDEHLHILIKIVVHIAGAQRNADGFLHATGHGVEEGGAFITKEAAAAHRSMGHQIGSVDDQIAFLVDLFHLLHGGKSPVH